MSPLLLAVAVGAFVSNLLWKAFDETILKPWLIKRTQEHLPPAIAQAVAMLDEWFPTMIDGHVDPAAMEDQLRGWAQSTLGVEWKAADTDATMTAWRPDVFLEKLQASHQ